MRWLIVSVLVMPVAALSATHPAASQSAYSYPVCLEYGLGGARSCYYANYEQCRYDAFTTPGGFCTGNPGYRGNVDRLPRASARPLRRRHS